MKSTILYLARRRRSPAPKLRAAHPIDYGYARQLCFSAMHELVDQAVGWNEYRMDTHFARQFRLDEVKIITAGSRAVGWLQLHHDAYSHELLNLFIEPAWQNRGIGGAVLKRLMAQAQKLHRPLTLWVMKQNRAQAFYRRHGFRMSGESPYELEMRLEPRHAVRGIGPSMGMRRG